MRNPSDPRRMTFRLLVLRLEATYEESKRVADRVVDVLYGEFGSYL